MCLILEKDSVKTIAHTDIVVYKVVVKVERRTIQSIFGFIQSEIFYRSPYYSFDYEKGVTYASALMKSTSPYSGNQTIEQGFHSYERLEDARLALAGNIVVVKCIIPAGAKFYKGHGIDFTQQYASDKIIIKEEVKL